jgi:hypothetical protein
VVLMYSQRSNHRDTQVRTHTAVEEALVISEDKMNLDGKSQPLSLGRRLVARRRYANDQIYIYIYIYIHICVYACTCICIYVFVCVCV